MGKKTDLVLLLKPRPSYAGDKVVKEYVPIEEDHQGLGLVRIAWFLETGPNFFQKIKKSWS